MKQTKKQIVCENGARFVGQGFGADVERVAELVFNTAMVGYQEILSDLSCCGQMVCMTYPLIGNYGLADDDYESKVPDMGGFIVREYNDNPSNYRYTQTLSEQMEEDGIPGIQGVDTRMLTRMIRDEGSMRVILTDADVPVEEALRRLRAEKPVTDYVRRVSCKKIWYSRTANPRYNVVAVDCGIRHSVIRSLNSCRCNVTIVPYDTPADTILALRPDGLLLSDGPGNPEEAAPVIGLVRDLQGRLPIFGIGLGCQIIALANGAKTVKMKVGHHGANQTVRNLVSGGIEVTSQSHIYAIDAASLAGTPLELTHVSLLDGTAEGVRCAQQQIFAVQFHLESCSGPKDCGYLLNTFIENMNVYKEAQGGAFRA